MKSDVETLSPTRVRLSVEVPFDELKPSVDSAYKKIAAQITIPGFRKGKVPAARHRPARRTRRRARRGRQRGAAACLRRRRDRERASRCSGSQTSRSASSLTAWP